MFLFLSSSRTRWRWLWQIYVGGWAIRSNISFCTVDMLPSSDDDGDADGVIVASSVHDYPF